MTKQFMNFMDHLTSQIAEAKVYTNTFVTTVPAMVDTYFNRYEIRTVVREIKNVDGLQSDLSIYDKDGEEVRPLGKYFLAQLSVLVSLGMPTTVALMVMEKESEEVMSAMRDTGMSVNEVANLMTLACLFASNSLNRWQEQGSSPKREYYLEWIKAMNDVDENLDEDYSLKFKNLLVDKLVEKGVKV